MLQGKEIRILLLMFIDTVFFLLEVIVGYAVNSLALIADSFHMLNDIISLIIAFWAVRVAKSKQADSKYTYGWQRAEILGLLINAVFLVALCFSIFIEAIQRFVQPQEITNPKLILTVGSCGLVSNFVGLFLFHDHGHSHSHDSSLSHDPSEHSHSHSSTPMYGSTSTGDIEDLLPDIVVNRMTNENERMTGSHSHYKHVHEHDDEHTELSKKQHLKSLNMQGVFLHVLGDALGNIGVIATALFIWKTDYSWRFYFDPLVSLLITAIIFSSLLPLCKSSSKILLQLTPANLPYDRVKKEILSISKVVSMHDFHIWNLTEKVFIASLHVEIDGLPEEFLEIATEIKKILHEYGVHNATIQPEFIRFYQKRGSTVSMNLLLDSSATSNTEDLSNCIIDSSIGCNTGSCIN